MNSVTENVSDFVNVYNGRVGTKRVAVVGDLMLDLYDQVHVSRISPEFPIPVINCHGDDAIVVRPGGAGNVGEQLRNFDAEVSLCSILDPEACGALNKTNIKYDSSVKFYHPGVQVPIKRRYYDGDYPLVRMDNERKNYGLGDSIANTRVELVKKFIDHAEKAVPDVVILSDYNKGLFCSSTARLLIDWCRDHQIPTIVDPKNDNICWNHCTIFKPNLAEAARFLGTTEQDVLVRWKWATDELRSRLCCESVVITAGSKGVFVCDKGEYFHYKPARPVGEVRSVIGAGDCFAAVLALAVAHGYAAADAAMVGYEAGAVYVQNKHNEPIWPHQLLGRAEDSYAKILDPTDLAAYCEFQKLQGKRVVFTNGCFDILHRGHVTTLEFAKKQGDILVVGVNTDDSIKRLKGPSRPINELYDRRIMLAALACVDFVTHFGEDTPKELIATLKPHVVVKGGQYAVEDVVGHDTCEVVLAPMEAGLSTTNLIEKMKS